MTTHRDQFPTEPAADGRADTRNTHVRVLADTATPGQPVYEVLPAARLDTFEYLVHGSPGLAYGFAAGDRLYVADDGTYKIRGRGQNLCLRAYPTANLSDDDISALVAAFEPLGGLVETPDDRRFVVVTVPISAGFPAVETAVTDWATPRLCEWEYGNVYDDNGIALGWWNE
jgi:hypothetical protein